MIDDLYIVYFCDSLYRLITCVIHCMQLTLFANLTPLVAADV